MGIRCGVLAGHSEEVMDCAISRDGSLVVSASEDDTLRLWNVRGGNVIVFRVSLVKRSPQIRTKYTQSR